ncbi:hypothetical protein T8T21_00785 [Limimaricola variabilis]|uniref:hypothetical protein n=1 Tax=Limimaricola variabilis TaxID=1492771 RepID=UPI002AC92506|nr:hypothetical protein [Limimaricola variabilis]WPY94694.1 hypothetical protein T8T21_00785 [Limimaricola variabilis]
MTAMGWVEGLSFAQVVLGVLISAITLIGFGLAWWDRRNRQYFDTKTAGMVVSATSQGDRLTKVEDRLGDLDNDLDRIRLRMTKIESDVGKLATSKEVHALAVAIAGQQAHLESQGNTLRMLYEAALRASRSGEA